MSPACELMQNAGPSTRMMLDVSAPSDVLALLVQGLPTCNSARVGRLWPTADEDTSL